MPDSQEPFKLVAIDPGTTCLGMSHMEWDFADTRRYVREAFTLKASDTAPHYQYLMDIHGARIARIMQLHDGVLDYLCRVEPHAVIVESPYMSRMPQAFAALTECVLAVRMAVMKYSPHLPFYLVDPSTAKKNAGVIFKKIPKGVKRDNKADINEALGKRTDLIYCMPRDSLDEHAIDSTAVGLYFFDQVI